MKVCLASIHPRLLSGQIESLLALRQGLEGLGHTVSLVSAFDPGLLSSEQRWAAASDGSSLIPKVARIGGIVRRVVAAARDCDVLHFSVPTPAFTLLADLVALLARVPTVVGFEAHLASVPALLRRLPAAPEFYAPRIVVNNGLVARLSLRRASRYIVSSRYQQRELFALGYDPRRVAVIPNLIDTSKLRRWPRETARAALGLPVAPLVAFVGHFHDVKGHDVLIDAFPDVLARVPEARLVLAWSGIGNARRVQAQVARLGIAEQTIQLGRLDVGQLFSAADVAALPYRFTLGQAAYPGTVLEAMAVGVPMVTSRLPLLEELVEPAALRQAQDERIEAGPAALLAEPGNAPALAQEIIRLLTDPALAQHLVEHQRAAMERRFNPEALVDEYVATYERALAGQARVLSAA